MSADNYVLVLSTPNAQGTPEYRIASLHESDNYDTCPVREIFWEDPYDSLEIVEKVLDNMVIEYGTSYLEIQTPFNDLQEFTLKKLRESL